MDKINCKSQNFFHCYPIFYYHPIFYCHPEGNARMISWILALISNRCCGWDSSLACRLGRLRSEWRFVLSFWTLVKDPSAFSTNWPLIALREILRAEALKMTENKTLRMTPLYYNCPHNATFYTLFSKKLRIVGADLFFYAFRCLLYAFTLSTFQLDSCRNLQLVNHRRVVE